MFEKRRPPERGGRLHEDAVVYERRDRAEVELRKWEFLTYARGRQNWRLRLEQVWGWGRRAVHRFLLACFAEEKHVNWESGGGRCEGDGVGRLLMG